MFGAVGVGDFCWGSVCAAGWFAAVEAEGGFEFSDAAFLGKGKGKKKSAKRGIGQTYRFDRLFGRCLMLGDDQFSHTGRWSSFEHEFCMGEG